MNEMEKWQSLKLWSIRFIIIFFLCVLQCGIYQSVPLEFSIETIPDGDNSKTVRNNNGISMYCVALLSIYNNVNIPKPKKYGQKYNELENFVHNT